MGTINLITLLPTVTLFITLMFVAHAPYYCVMFVRAFLFCNNCQSMFHVLHCQCKSSLELVLEHFFFYISLLSVA